MYKARQFLTKKALLMLYHAYIYPYMAYCIKVWDCASQTQPNCIFWLQKKIIRIMSFSHYLAHTNPLFLSMEVLRSFNTIRSGGGGGGFLRFFVLTHLILELHYCTLGTFPKK